MICRRSARNLCDHYPVRLVARVKNQQTVNEQVRGLNLVKEAMKYVFTRKGVLTLSPTLVHIFWKSHEAMGQGRFADDLHPPRVTAKACSRSLTNSPGMTVAAWQQRPESMGYVRAKSGSAMDKPAIQPNYLAHETDRRVLLGGIRLGRKMLETPELAPFYDREEYPRRAAAE